MARNPTAAIVFDVGGVLTRTPRGDNARFVSAQLGIGLETVERTFSSARRRLSSGVVDAATFWRDYAGEHGGSVPEGWLATYQARFASVVQRVPDMAELVSDVRRAGIRTAVLTNVIPSRVDAYRSIGVYDGFDPVVLSCAVGMVKPDAEIFEYTLERLGLPASEVALVDDKSANVEAAVRLGWRGFQFSSAAALRGQLQAD